MGTSILLKHSRVKDEAFVGNWFDYCHSAFQGTSRNTQSENHPTCPYHLHQPAPRPYCLHPPTLRPCCLQESRGPYTVTPWPSSSSSLQCCWQCLQKRRWTNCTLRPWGCTRIP